MARGSSTGQEHNSGVAEKGVALSALFNAHDVRPATQDLPYIIIEAKPGQPVVVPASGLLEGADYVRSGPDLILIGEDGTRILVRDYFATDDPSDLIGDNGATIDGDLASRLAGSMAPGEFAQAKAGLSGQSIGRADTMSGSVNVIHADGTKGMLSKGDAVFQGDILQTPKGASVGLVFMDGTTLALGGNGRLVLDQMVYDPSTHTGKSAFSLVQGTFSFVSGEIAKSAPDAASLKTPVATIGIRGTMVAGGYTPETGLTTALLQETGGIGEITVTNQAGSQVLNQASTALHIVNFFTPPSNAVSVNNTQITNSFHEVLQQTANISSNNNASSSAQQILNQAGPAGQTGPQTNTNGAAQPGAGPAIGPAAGQAPTTVEGALQSAAPQAQATGFAQAAQQAINQALQQGTSIDQAVGAAMQAQQAYNQAVNQGASAQQALNAAGLAAQQTGVLGATPFVNIPVTNTAPANAPGTTDPNASIGPTSQSGSGTGDVIRVTLNSAQQGGASTGSTSSSGSTGVTDTSSANSSSTNSGIVQVVQTEQTTATTSSNNDTNTTSSTTTTSTPTVVSLSGKAVDGYISGATVFLDADNDGTLDSGEIWTTTDSQGNYTLASTNTSVPIVLFGGTDISTNQALVGTLKAPAGSTVVTPLTTMMQSMMASGLTEASAQSQIATMLGISSLPDLNSFDPVAQSSSGNSSTVTQAAQVMKAAIQVQNMVTAMSALMVGAGGVTAAAATAAIFSALASQATSASGSVDFSNSSNVSSLIDSVASNLSLTGDADLTAAKATVATVIANVTSAVNTAFNADPTGGTDLLTSLANVATVAQGSATSAIQNAFTSGDLSAALTSLGTDYNSSNLDNAIASASSGLVGSSGSDTLTGTSGNDTISGLGGNDTLAGLAGDDSLSGGEGTDTATFAAAGAGITLSLESGSATGGAGNDRLSGIEIVIGSGHDDTLTGGSGADSLYGGGGNDTLISGDGNEYLDGGDGTDVVSYANAGSSTTVNLTTGVATGGRGSDTLLNIEDVIGSAYADVLTGGTTANSLYGMGGDDTLSGGLGNDLIVGGEGSDTVSFASAASGVVVNLANDTSTGEGSDTLSSIENVIGSASNDSITGSTGNNILSGGAGADTINAGTGVDVVSGGLGDDILNGGDDADTLSYAASATAVNVDLGAGTATGEGSDTISNFEVVAGSELADTITGSSSADTLLGGSGNDSLYGGLGGDSIDGGAGDDIIYGDPYSGSIAATNSLVNGLGGSSGFGENTLPVGDDSSNTLADITSVFSGGITFFGSTYSDLGFNTNGHVTFGQAYYQYYAEDYPLSGTSNPPILAPLYYDVDTRNRNAVTPTVGGNSTGSNLVWYDLDTTNNIITVTWDDVGYYNQNNSALNAFQLQIFYLGASGDFDVAFRYEAVNYSYSNDARAGWSASDGVAGHYYELPESNSSGVLALDTSNGNSGTAGLWTWSFRSGALSSSGGLGSGGDDESGGNDILAGGDGNDRVYGGYGDDTLSGGAGDDTLSAGYGTDTLTYEDSETAVTVNLATSTATGEGTDTISGFERVTGSSYNDSLTGSSGDDLLSGGDGDDRLNGGSAMEVGDTLLGGGGNDTIDYSNTTFAATINGGDGSDTLLFSGASLDLNLSSSTISFSNLEKIDMTGSGDNTLRLTGANLLSLAEDSNGLLSGLDYGEALIIDGNAGDTLLLNDIGWSQPSSVTISGEGYSVYTSNSYGESATLLVDTSVTVVSGLQG